MNSPGGELRDPEDFTRLCQARERSVGFAVGQYLQPPPMLFTRDGHNVFLGDMYRGHTAFLLCGGPSLTTHNLDLLNQRGILTMAVNNVATVVRPQLWCSVDDPGNFSDAIWFDPGVTKFVPLSHMEKTFTVRNEHGEIVDSTDKVGDMPAVFGFRRNEAFVAEQFLKEDTFNWGNHGARYDALRIKGSRSVMYIAIRLLYYLGVRTINLLGCDFRMTYGQQNYAFEQDRTRAAVRGNNQTYEAMNRRFDALRPYFAEAGLSIFNCTPNSGLKSFPAKSYEQAIEEATAVIPKRIVTAGMYERKAQTKIRVGGTRGGETELKPTEPEKVLADIPELTIVVPVNTDDIARLTTTWKTWLKFKPWIKNYRLQFLVHPGIEIGKLDALKSSHPQAEVTVMGVDESSRVGWERAKVTEVPRHVHTDWFLMLAPSAVATSVNDWINPVLFNTSSSSSLPAFTACSWGYTKPANVYENLDAWADQIGFFNSSNHLDWSGEVESNRVPRPSISTWAFLGNAQWCRQIASLVTPETPIVEHSSFVLFCAARHGDQYYRIPMKEFGWDHSFSQNNRKLERTCRDVLAAAGP